MQIEGSLGTKNAKGKILKSNKDKTKINISFLVFRDREKRREKRMEKEEEEEKRRKKRRRSKVWKSMELVWKL